MAVKPKSKKKPGRKKGENSQVHEAAHRLRFLVELLRKKEHDGLTVFEIQQKLAQAGFDEITDKRLRDILNNMSIDHRSHVDRIGEGYRSRWKSVYKVDAAELALTDPNEAVRIALLGEADITQVLPRSIRTELETELLKARKWLYEKRNVEKMARWPERVRLRRPSVRLAVDRKEPEIERQVESTVHEALIKRLALRVTYDSGHLSSVLDNMTVFPIGLDCQLRWVTLVCQLGPESRKRYGGGIDRERRKSDKYGEDYVQLPLHRIKTAELGNGLEPGFDAKFNMDEYVRRAEPDRPRGGESRAKGREIRLVARVTPPYANDLGQSSLETTGEPQSLTPMGDGWFKLTADVIESDNLKWWCVAMAGDMEVLGPPDFRKKVIAMLDEGRALYTDA